MERARGNEDREKERATYESNLSPWKYVIRFRHYFTKKRCRKKPNSGHAVCPLIRSSCSFLTPPLFHYTRQIFLLWQTEWDSKIMESLRNLRILLYTVCVSIERPCFEGPVQCVWSLIYTVSSIWHFSLEFIQCLAFFVSRYRTVGRLATLPWARQIADPRDLRLFFLPPFPVLLALFCNFLWKWRWTRRENWPNKKRKRRGPSCCGHGQGFRPESGF